MVDRAMMTLIARMHQAIKRRRRKRKPEGRRRRQGERKRRCETPCGSSNGKWNYSLALSLSCRLRNARDREREETNLTLREWFADQRARISTRSHTHTEAMMPDRADFLISAVRTNRISISSSPRSLPVAVDSISRQKQQQLSVLRVLDWRWQDLLLRNEYWWSTID